MKRGWTILLVAALAAGALLWIPQSPPPVNAASSGKHFLIRFGGDGKANVDWSGSLDAAGATLKGWQFDAKQDRVDGLGWKCATTQQDYWDTPYERSMKGTSNRDKVTAKGIVLTLPQPAPRVRVTTTQGEFTFDTSLAIADPPRRFLDGRATVEAVPAGDFTTNNQDAEDYPSLLEAKDGTLWMAYQSYDGAGESVWVKRLQGDVWSQPEPLAPAGGDYFRTALAQDAAGHIWAVWSAAEKGNYDLYARRFDGKSWSRPERLTSAPNSDIYHSLVADARGNLYLAYQSSRLGNFDIYLRRFDGKRWSAEVKLSDSPANDWEPSIAAAPNGDVTVVWDSYAAGNYDLHARTYAQGKWGPLTPIAASGAFESRASARYDRQGRLWVAYDEGDWNWGKDYGNLVTENGRGLLVRRQLRLAVLDKGRLQQPVAPLADAVPADFRQVFQHANLAFDGNDNPWLLFRTRVNTPRNGGKGAHRTMWRMFGMTLRDGKWSQAFEFPQGYGRIDMAAAMAPRRDGSLAVVWASDGRIWPEGRPLAQDLRFAAIPSGPRGGAPELTAFVPSAENLTPSHPDDRGDVERVRAWRARAGAQTLQIVRGDLHRHTDLSWDGNRDGSLDDAYRYALDAAGFDYLGVCDHQAGESIAYNWWRIQKAVDLYTIQGRFAPVYSYERSLPWPNGHRNVFFATRGRPILDLSNAEQRGTEGAANLYAYLRKFGGLTSSHTSATGAGTDWRDSDAELEPVVEIYQGYRNNFETPDGPRANTGQEAKRFEAGFVRNAWAKGIKMGVQSSSDHTSTHISYAAFYVERIDREAILAAMKARRSYAATDNLIVEIRMGDHFMGSAFAAPAPLPLTVKVRGTRPLAHTQVIRNNKVVYTVPGNGAEAAFTWTDSAPESGESFYYVRAQQQDGQIVWSSPIWRRQTP